MARQSAVTKPAYYTGRMPVSINKHDPFRFAKDMISYCNHRDMCRVAAKAKVCTDTLYRWHRGEVKSPNLRTLKGVIEAFGCRLVVK